MNKESQAGTAADSSTQPIDTTSASLAQSPMLAAGWISMKDAVPPYNKGVLVTDNKGTVSFGRIYKISTGYKANGGEPTVSYEWKSVEPHVQNPTHWMPLPACR